MSKFGLSELFSPMTTQATIAVKTPDITGCMSCWPVEITCSR